MTQLADEVAARAWVAERFDAIDRLERLAAMLREENERQNLVARASLDQVWQRHIVDSAQLLTVSRETVPAGLWLDLGTGAGFPGLVIAAIEPDRPVTLVDSRRLRTQWLRRAAESLDLPNVRVVLARVEDLPDCRAAVISARAFAPLPRLLELSARFSTPQTLWLLPKGARALQELAELESGWRHLFHVEQSLTDPEAGVLVGHLLDTSSRNSATHPNRGSSGKGRAASKGTQR